MIRVSYIVYYYARVVCINIHTTRQSVLLTVDFGAFAIDRITAEQRDAIKKTSTERLSARLQQAGWSPDDVAVLDREQLMQAVAGLYTVQVDT